MVGKAPKAQPVSTVITIAETLIEQYKPRDFVVAIQYAPGVNVTVGRKREATPKLRGMDSRRISLLIDGVPSYEPRYGSFDLKTVSAAKSFWHDATSGKVLDILSYFNLDAIAAYDFGRFELFVKATNLLDD